MGTIVVKPSPIVISKETAASVSNALGKLIAEAKTEGANERLRDSLATVKAKIDDHLAEQAKGGTGRETNAVPDRLPNGKANKESGNDDCGVYEAVPADGGARMANGPPGAAGERGGHCDDGGKTPGGVDWATVDWASVDWSAIDWSAIDWSTIDWSAIDWSKINWSAIDWDSVDWDSIDWDSVDWGSVDWAGIDWGSVDWNGIDWGGNSVQKDVDSVDWDAVGKSMSEGIQAVDWDAVGQSLGDGLSVAFGGGNGAPPPQRQRVKSRQSKSQRREMRIGKINKEK